MKTTVAIGEQRKHPAASHYAIFREKVKTIVKTFKQKTAK